LASMRVMLCAFTVVAEARRTRDMARVRRGSGRGIVVVERSGLWRRDGKETRKCFDFK
jgi:hypothetical protein